MRGSQGRDCSTLAARAEGLQPGAAGRRAHFATSVKRSVSQIGPERAFLRRIRRTAGILLAGVLLLGGKPAWGQQVSSQFAHWEPTWPASTRDTAPAVSGDYRHEGLVFGAVVFGAAGAWIGAHHFSACPLEPGVGCGRDENLVAQSITLGLIGAAAGGGLGYLIGRLSPKKARPDSVMFNRSQLHTVPDSIRRIAGYQHWRGAGLGLGIGAGLGTLLGTIAPLSCDDCQTWSRGRAMWTVGLVGAGTGAVVGFLAGLVSPKYVWVPGDDAGQSLR